MLRKFFKVLNEELTRDDLVLQVLDVPRRYCPFSCLNLMTFAFIVRSHQIPYSLLMLVVRSNRGYTCLLI